MAADLALPADALQTVFDFDKTGIDAWRGSTVRGISTFATRGSHQAASACGPKPIPSPRSTT
jgi:hypothetical protein